MSIVIISGTFALVTSFIGLLPQIYKSLKTKSTKDLSQVMLLNYFVCSLAWIIYGSYTDSMFVLASNALGLLSSLILLLQKHYYDSRTL
ncbi:MAG: PQ-loop repeat-containing protein [Legionella sp.]|nr:MAG: PQ-loop repeat-containing protein [Legionella sp.]